MVDASSRSPHPVVRELAAMLTQYRLRKIGPDVLLAWLNDGWSQDRLGQADDRPTRWLAPKVRATLLEAQVGQISDDQAHAAIVALVREHRRRREVDLWPEE